MKEAGKRNKEPWTSKFFSVVVPTFSRPDEVFELLSSLEAQQNRNFEVIIADGSMDDSVRHVIEKHIPHLKLKYLHHRGLGISESRNWGVENATGEYVVFFDSDCLIPPGYFTVVDKFLQTKTTDAWGGPDRAHGNFNLKQKSISYAMTSLFTTGGIRGRKMHAGQYQPRSFNMGIRREVFTNLGGFSGLKVSEDIDLSLRLYRNGHKITLMEEAFVYHKRRSTFYKFFRQVFSFGSSRIDLQFRHGNALKPVHVLPSLFVLYVLSGIIPALISKGVFYLWLLPILVYCIVILVDSIIQNRSLLVGLLSVYSSIIMLTGYGTGMMKALFLRHVLGSKKESEKPEITKEA
jgi:glycosyltransferase involved in cell wall biosynthesis